MSRPQVVPSISAAVDPMVEALWRQPRAAAEQMYLQAFQKGDREALRFLALNDRYFLLTCLLRRPDARHDWIYARCREVEADPDGYIDLWARDHYKLLSVDEPVPTPTGWARHGELNIGDEVFGPDGMPCRVVARTPVFEAPPQFRITFDDGTTIDAGDDHFWIVQRRTRKRVPGSWKKDGIGKRLYREAVKLSTSEIAEHNHRPDNRLLVLNAEPLQLPHLTPLIDPYLLGCWLGDGTAATGEITCGDDIWVEIAKMDVIGPDKTPDRNSDCRRIDDLHRRLRKLDLLKNKHIPGIYQRASPEQRLALLQGLMDTDGHCDTRGTATFVNTNKRLVFDVYELLAGLGLKPHLRKVDGTYKGQSYPYWQLSFQAHLDQPPFRLRRKLERCLRGIKRAHSKGRFIVSCERIEPKPGSCIQVDHPTGCYLAGRAMIPTHNSTIITFAGIIQEILRDPEITICIFSHVKPAAKDFLGQVKRELEDNEFLKSLFSDVLWANPRKEAPWWSEDGGIVVRRESNPKEATLEASGLVDGMATGKHFRLRVYDDVVTEQTVTTPEMIKKVTTQFELSEHLGQKDGRSWMIGTRYHFGDTYGIILQRGVYQERRYAATHDGTFDGNPVFLTLAQWEKKKAASSKSTIAAQMLLNPLAGSETKFDIRWLKRWFVRPKRINVYILVDPSKGKHATSDNTAIAVIGVDIAQNRYLLDGWCHRMNLSRRWKVLRDLWKRWSRMPGVATVRIGYEEIGMQTDLEHFELMMEQEKIAFPIEPLAWPRSGPKSKEHRIERLEPDFRMGRMMIPGVIDIDEEGNVSPYDPSRKKIVQEAIKAKETWRVARPILQINEDERRYDVLMQLLEEYVFFPFAPRDDFLDAMSRIYDLDPVAPLYYEREPGHATSTEPPVYMDT